MSAAGKVSYKILAVIILGLYRDSRKEKGNGYIVYWGYIGIMEMETTIKCIGVVQG